MPDSETIEALASLITAIAWPTLVLLFLFLNRGTISKILENLESLTLPGGVEAKFNKAVESEVEAVMIAKKDSAQRITSRQIEASDRVAKLAHSQGSNVIREKILESAREYERVRAAMSASDERTRQMEKVTTKMRTLAAAGSFMLDELTRSSSPGERLAAIAILQVNPDAGHFDWLANRLGAEQPFIGYHAAVALLTASRIYSDADQANDLRESIRAAKGHLGDHNRGTDRDKVLDDALRELGT